MDPPTQVSWVRIPARGLYSFFVGFSGFYFLPIFKNCLWEFVELFFFKIASIFAISIQCTTTYLSRSMPAKIWRCLISRYSRAASGRTDWENTQSDFISKAELRMHWKVWIFVPLNFLFLSSKIHFLNEKKLIQKLDENESKWVKMI